MWFAHSGKKGGGKAEPLKEHLQLVAQRAANYASFFGAGEEAQAAGLLHDLGKYSGLFLRRLENKESGLDHWSAGAYTALAHYKLKAFAGALAIQGHHIGLQHALISDALQREFSLAVLNHNHPLNLRLTEQDHKILLHRLQADGLSLPSMPLQSVYNPQSLSIAGMLDVRMLFSALVDADYIETEAHFQGDPDGTKRYRQEGVSLEADKAMGFLLDYLAKIRRESKADEKVNSLREDLLNACLDTAELPPGVFTLTAPTGAGKTLAMLAFALKHVQKHKNTFRRIVMVIPYLTIIEQTARIYRDIFQSHFGEHYVLEHHSLAGTRQTRKGVPQDNEEPAHRTAQLLAENWDAPLVVTTSVQCLESLFSNRPSACRKLHRLAGSIILFDEVQTLPTKLAIPTLASLARLAERYNATVVFSTATQPAFSHLDAEVRAYSSTGWQPQEIVSNTTNLFERARRTQVEWNIDPPRSWKDLAEELGSQESEQVLCIVNLKRHAQKLAELLKKRKTPGLFHLSTNMCPAHREVVLDAVRTCLDPKSPTPCRLISTQCVEAGVDVDFPVVYRAFGPLEAIAQAAGRCNRNGNLSQPGKVRVFMPEPEPDKKKLYPPGGYGQAADVTLTLLNRGAQRMDINDPALFEAYYKTLYDMVQNTVLPPELEDALNRRHFVETAEQYRLIDQDTVNVLIPYDSVIFQERKEELEPETVLEQLRIHWECRFQELQEELEQTGQLTRNWIRKAKPYTISLFRPRDGDVKNFLNPVPLWGGEKSDDWFVYLKPEHYTLLLGLNPPQGPENWMV